jgi:hypothetical protein
LEGGRSEFKRWRWRKDGERYWAGVIMAPIRRETGELTSASISGSSDAFDAA